MSSKRAGEQKWTERRFEICGWVALCFTVDRGRQRGAVRWLVGRGWEQNGGTNRHMPRREI
jgi:hypothetical protein